MERPQAKNGLWADPPPVPPWEWSPARAEERDEWLIGDGALRVESDREGLLAWLVHGDGDAVETTGELPELPGL